MSEVLGLTSHLIGRMTRGMQHCQPEVLPFVLQALAVLYITIDLVVRKLSTKCGAEGTVVPILRCEESLVEARGYDLSPGF